MEKIKSFIKSDTGKDILIVLIVILVGLGSFELGRLSKDANSSGIKLEYPAGIEAQNQAGSAILGLETTNPETNSKPSEKAFFASNRGSKYYPAGCAGGKTIKQENRVYFATSEDAERAGYELSSSCK